MAGQRCAATSPYATVSSTSAGGTLVEVSPGACTRSAAARLRAGDPNVEIIKLDLSREGTMALYVDAAGVVRRAGGQDLPWLGRSPSDGPVRLAVGERGIVPTGLLERGLPPGRSLKYPLGSNGEPLYMTTALQARGIGDVRVVPTLTGAALSVPTRRGATRRGPVRFTVGDGKNARSHTVLPNRRPAGSDQGHAASGATLVAEERKLQAELAAVRYEEARGAAKAHILAEIMRAHRPGDRRRELFADLHPTAWRDTALASAALLANEGATLAVAGGAPAAVGWATLGVLTAGDARLSYENEETPPDSRKWAAARAVAIGGAVAAIRLGLDHVLPEASALALGQALETTVYAGRLLLPAVKEAHRIVSAQRAHGGLTLGVDQVGEAHAEQVLSSFEAELKTAGLEGPEIAVALSRVGGWDRRLARQLLYPDPKVSLAHRAAEAAKAARGRT